MPPPTPKNAYFQSAFLPPSPPTHISIRIAHRAWHIPRSLLAHSSPQFASLLAQSPHTRELNLSDTVSAAAFAEYVDYVYSGILTFNVRASEYHAVGSAVAAVRLGRSMGDAGYVEAAMRALYAAVAMVKDSGNVTVGTEEERKKRETRGMEWRGNAAKCAVRARDVKDVLKCDDEGDLVRILVIRGVIRGWATGDVLELIKRTRERKVEMAATEMDGNAAAEVGGEALIDGDGGDVAASGTRGRKRLRECSHGRSHRGFSALEETKIDEWIHVYRDNSDFRGYLAEAMRWADVGNPKSLGEVEDYVGWRGAQR